MTLVLVVVSQDASQRNLDVGCVVVGQRDSVLLEVVEPYLLHLWDLHYGCAHNDVKLALLEGAFAVLPLDLVDQLELLCRLTLKFLNESRKSGGCSLPYGSGTLFCKLEEHGQKLILDGLVREKLNVLVKVLGKYLFVTPFALVCFVKSLNDLGQVGVAALRIDVLEEDVQVFKN